MMKAAEVKKSAWRSAALVAAAAVLVTGFFLNIGERRQQKGTVLIDGKIAVSVDVAATAAAREKGLSGREALGPGQGMLFVFPYADDHAFWMKDMKFPIDFLWIRDGEVIDMTVDVPAPLPGEPLPRYFPASPADMVLEVGAGFVREKGLKTGMPIDVSVDNGR